MNELLFIILIVTCKYNIDLQEINVFPPGPIRPYQSPYVSTDLFTYSKSQESITGIILVLLHSPDCRDNLHIRSQLHRNPA